MTRLSLCSLLVVAFCAIPLGAQDTTSHIYHASWYQDDNPTHSHMACRGLDVVAYMRLSPEGNYAIGGDGFDGSGLTVCISKKDWIALDPEAYQTMMDYARQRRIDKESK